MAKQHVLMASGMIKDIISDLAGEDGTVDGPIPLGNVIGETLQRIVEYCEHYNGNPPSVDENQTVDITGWEQSFIDLPQPHLFDLILGANYMAVTPLLHLGCKKVAHMLKNKSKDEIRQIFNVTRIFTSEEEAEAKKDPAWVDDPSLPSN